MEHTYIEDQTFERINFATTAFPAGNYENCTFEACDFSNANISGFSFSECRFNNCNVSLVKTHNTTFTAVRFSDCKLVGLPFDTCNPLLLSVSFENCTLNFASFYKRNLKKTVFKRCLLHEADFTEANLAGSQFDACDLSRAVFENTVLEGVDFRTAFHYSIDPAINRVKGAKFSLAGIAGLLDKYDIQIDS
jgi:fluoroquinolone resistance protein